MLNFALSRRCAAVFSALCLAACGGALLIVPLFEFGFNNADGSVGIFFTPSNPTTESGDFDPAAGVSLNINTGAGSVTTKYKGSYSGCGFELVAASTPVVAPAAASYSGRFINKDTIELRRPGDSTPSYTLNRFRPEGVKPTPDFGC